ncbi:MAG: DUF1249 domain-containing protein [Pseudomonadota bacterium]|nr:DUF1249 domain-containing protein [Pseudomonadota bacterium]
MNVATVPLLVHRYAQPNLASLLALYEQNYAALFHLLGMAGPYPSGAVARPSRLPALYLSVLERERFTTTYHLTHHFGQADESQMVPDLQLRVYHDARQCEAIPSPAPASRRGNPMIPMSERWTVNIMLNKWLRYCLDHGYCFGGIHPSVTDRSQAARAPDPE